MTCNIANHPYGVALLQANSIIIIKKTEDLISFGHKLLNVLGGEYHWMLQGCPLYQVFEGSVAFKMSMISMSKFFEYLPLGG